MQVAHEVGGPVGRVETPLFVRNPYLFGDTTWGVMYVAHGLTGIALVFAFICGYFLLRAIAVPLGVLGADSERGTVP